MGNVICSYVCVEVHMCMYIKPLKYVTLTFTGTVCIMIAYCLAIMHANYQNVDTFVLIIPSLLHITNATTIYYVITENDY